MINSITMRQCATYDAEGVSIDNCPKINFIYGPNGSGKSTISNYLQNTSEAMYSNCKIQWENDITAELVVYNRRFRERNFKGNIAGVFTLGAATIEDIKHLEELKAEREKRYLELKNRKAALQHQEAELTTCKNDFKQTVWNVILKENEKDFQEAFTGLRSNKDKFRDAVIKKYNVNHDSSETRDTLKKRALKLFSEKPEKCAPIDLSIDELINKLIVIENDDIWEKIIVGNKDVPIAKLIDFLNNADWVNRGRAFINKDGYCPFCQQKTISEDFKEQLDSFFSGEYEENIKYIGDIISQYKNISEQLYSALQSVLSNERFINISGIDVEKYNTKKDLLSTIFLGNLSEMTSKEKEPGIRVRIQESKIVILELKSMIISANDSIASHNEIVDHFNTEKNKLIDDIWTFLLDEQDALISGYLNDLKNFDKALCGIKRGIKSFQDQVTELDKQIIEAEKNITSVQPTVDEINRSLKAYGFENFEIVASTENKNSYQIKRPDGTLATNTLSEGEETFISFLYFLQLAKGSTDITKVSSHKILVIDDPICSLDSTILYIVSAMVKDLIVRVKEGKSDVEQLFILTHNVFFHKEASFIDGRTQEDKNVNYWVIYKDSNISHIKPYGMKNPIKTSYELLWQELKDCTSGSLVTTQNIMRRIIENYFGMLGNRKYDYVAKRFKTIEEQMICKSLFYWINDGSHTIPDDLYIDSYSDSVEKYKKVFKEIFFVTGHNAHYDMRMGAEASL